MRHAQGLQGQRRTHHECVAKAVDIIAVTQQRTADAYGDVGTGRDDDATQVDVVEHVIDQGMTGAVVEQLDLWDDEVAAVQRTAAAFGELARSVGLG